MNNSLEQIVAQFCLEGKVNEIKPLGEGFINDTFIVSTANHGPKYILQRKNGSIFTDIPAIMNNIFKVTQHLKKKVAEKGGDPMREAMTIIPTLSDKYYFQDSENDYWTICLFIEDNITYQSADTTELAYSGGKGIGLFQSMLSDMNEKLTDILPGFHNIRYRFNQWDDAIKEDCANRVEFIGKEIEWIEDRREEMLRFWSLIEEGVIPTRVTHNDTKINNILFDQQGEVLCVIDLDTVLNSSALNDFGDAIRSYTNTGLEDDTDLNKVSMDINLFRAYTKGYLSEAKEFISKEELEWLAFSAKYITYEQVLRFLMDYINGDTYYKTKYKDHNLVRTHAQFKLLESMEEQYSTMKKIVTTTFKELQKKTILQ